MDVRSRVRIWRYFAVPGTDMEYYTLDGAVAMTKALAQPGDTITDRNGLVHVIRSTTEAYATGLLLHIYAGDLQLVGERAGDGKTRMLREMLEHAYMTGELIKVMIEELSMDSAGNPYDKRNLYWCAISALPDFGLDMLAGPWDGMPDVLDLALVIVEEYTFRDFDDVTNALPAMYPGGNLAIAYTGGDGTAVTAGQTLTGATAHSGSYPTAYVASITITSGSFAGHDAAGVIELRGIDGDFLDTEIANASGGGHVHVSGYMYVPTAYQRPARPS